jgi:hypothetical protein
VETGSILTESRQGVKPKETSDLGQPRLYGMSRTRFGFLLARFMEI